MADTRTRVGRKTYPDPKGGVYSEKTVTFPLDGKWYTFPSVDKSGNIMSEDAVADYVRRNGPVDPITGERFPVFDDVQSAEEFARGRSSGLLDEKSGNTPMSIFPHQPLGILQEFQPPQQAAPPPQVIQAPSFANGSQPPVNPLAALFGGGQGNGSPMGNILQTIMMGIGSDLATGRQGSGAPMVAQMMQQRQGQRKRNKTLEMMKKDPRFAPYMKDVEAGYMTPAEAYKQAMQPAPERKMFDPGDGRKYWQDTLEPVMPGIETKQDLERAEQQRELEAAERARQIGDRKAIEQSTIVTQDIDRAIAMLDKSDSLTGMQGSLMSKVPGTDAHNLSRLMETIKANAGFDKLQAMRDASPTGGALGQVSNIELSLLQSAIGNLEQSQTEDQLRYNLERVRGIYQGIIDGKFAGDPAIQQEMQQKQQQAAPMPSSGQEITVQSEAEALAQPPGTVVILNGRKFRVEE